MYFLIITLTIAAVLFIYYKFIKSKKTKTVGTSKDKVIVVDRRPTNISVNRITDNIIPTKEEMD